MKRTLNFSATFHVQKAEPNAEGKFFVEGIASHGSEDTYGDKISQDAMKQLCELMIGKVVLHGHDPDQEIGIVREAMVIDDNGVPAAKVVCEIMDADSIEKIKDGRLQGFSIHAIAGDIMMSNTPSGTVWTIMSWERFVELSMTSVPVQEKAQVLGWFVKSMRELAVQHDGEMQKRLAALKALGAVHGGKKGMNAIIAFLRSSAEALRAIETEDTPAKEAILAIAQQLDDKATMIETEENDNASSGDGAGNTEQTQEGAGTASEEEAAVEDACGSGDKKRKKEDDGTAESIAALTEQLAAAVARIDALEAAASTKAAALDEVTRGLASITTAHAATATAVEGVQASVKTMGETVQTKLAGMEQQIAANRPSAGKSDDKAEKGSPFSGLLFG